MLINSLLILITLFFVLIVVINKINLLNEEKNLIYLLLFFFLSLTINLAFSNDWLLSLPRVLKFILIICSVLAFKLLSKDNIQIQNVYKLWVLVFFIVLVDIIIEIILGKNILGNSSIIPGRISSFTGDDMNIGHYFSAFVLIVLSFLHYKFQNNTLNLTLAVLFIIISFLIGERSNFIKTLLMILIFSFYTIKIKKRYFIILLFSFSIFFTTVLNNNDAYKLRYYSQLSSIWSHGINDYLDNSIYGSHYAVAKAIFNENPVFGVGIKNFRIASYDEKYQIDHKFNHLRANTHPHQVHYEFLSETGIFGYVCFWIFIIISFTIVFKDIHKNKNLYQISGLLYVFVNLLPLIPSGSFFSTFAGALFWLNYSLMMSLHKK